MGEQVPSTNWSVRNLSMNVSKYTEYVTCISQLIQTVFDIMHGWISCFTDRKHCWHCSCSTLSLEMKPFFSSFQKMSWAILLTEWVGNSYKYTRLQNHFIFTMYYIKHNLHLWMKILRLFEINTEISICISRSPYVYLTIFNQKSCNT